MANARSYQKRDSGSSETGERGGEREGTGAAFGGILLGKPQRVDREIRAAESQKKQADKEPRSEERRVGKEC